MDRKLFEHRKLLQRREQSVQALFDELDNTELDGCKFLCEPYISSALLKDIRKGGELVPLLARKNKIDFEQPHFDFLVELLYRVHRLDLVTDLGTSADNVRMKYNDIQHTNMIAFRCLLLSLSYDLTNENLEAILEIMRCDADIGIGRLSRIKTTLDLFRLLMKEVKLKHDDFQWLSQIVELIERQDLLSKIRYHAERSCRSLTFHPSIDSIGQTHYFDRDAKAYKDKKMVSIMNDQFPVEYSTPITWKKGTFAYNKDPSPTLGLQAINRWPSILGNQYGEETQAKQSPNFPEPFVEHLAPGTRAPDLMDSELLSKIPCGLPEPIKPAYGKMEDRKESKEETTNEPLLPLPTEGSTLIGHTEDPSSGYISSERDLQLPRPLSARYKMSADPRGICIVVNNEVFEANMEHFQGRPHERRGSNIDAERLMKTFSSLKFETEIYTNLSAMKLVTLISETGNKDHTNFDSFVLCLLSHGRKGEVFGTDWKPVAIKELTKYLQAPYCRSLAGKPKIIIIQACQGKGRQLCDDLEEDVNPTAVRGTRPSTNTGDHGETADFVIVNSTCPGYSSLRSPSDGAFFIQTLVDGLEEHAQRCDFITILEEVNKKMSKRIKRRDGREYIQTPSHQSTLKAKIYFI